MSAGSAALNNANANIDDWRPAVNPWIIAITVTLATFMEVLDTSIANVALPHIAGSLSAGQDESTWVLTSYLVSNAIVLALSGWLSSILGRKRFYMGCVAVFTISSALCGFALNLPMLIVLDKGQREDWFESRYILVLSLVAAASLIFAVFWEWRHKDPIVELHLYKERTFATANFLMFMLGFSLLGSTLLLPLFMQTLLGYTAEQAGLALSPGGFTILCLLPMVAFLLSRYDARYLIAAGLTTLSLSLYHM